MHVLDNPIWHALTSDQSELAEGDAWARRFPADIGPLAGLADQSAQAYESLARLAKPDEQLVLFLREPPLPPADWTLDVDGLLTQIVFEADDVISNGSSDNHVGLLELIETMTEADIPAMLELTRLTKPGPFRRRTNELGLYLGIHLENQLAAMAGERLKPSGFTEVSAVCTHPDFQGRGAAQALILSVVEHIRQLGRTPFLHSRPDNTPAIRVYEKLGFRIRRMMHLAVLRHR
jgi:ribosomal protein S18 acetylase RimI-like enzyme